VLEPQDDLGTGFIMERVEGETIPENPSRRKIRGVRPGTRAPACGILAAIHGLPLAQLPELRRVTSTKEIAELERDYRSFDWPRPVSRWRWAGFATMIPVHPNASRWCTAIFATAIHHRPRGVRAVLDWELAHLGDPMEDLGWVCVNSWRFGQIDRPVGGFGSRERAFRRLRGGTRSPR